MRKYDAVLFDLDGTLLDTLQDLAKSVNTVLTRHNLPPRSCEEIRGFVGNGYRKLLIRAVPDGENHPKFEQILSEFQIFYGKHCMDMTKPYPGVLCLLSELKKRDIRLAIVSNKGDAAVKELNRVYFGNLVDAAVGERAGLRRKPEPDSVLEALSELDVPDGRAAYVGDSEVDLLTAQNARLPGYLVTWGFRSREDLLRAGAVREQMAESAEELLSLLTD